PWNRTLESSSAMQGGAMIPVGGGQIREPQSGVKKPVNPPNANKNDPKKPAGVGPAFPNPAGGPMPAGVNPGANPMPLPIHENLSYRTRVRSKPPEYGHQRMG
ncbi:MAG: hypothetical protein MUD03_14800, partial [Pirellula sp.]|nr:hypothetical protein [Pirellula sp.]